MPVTRNQPKPGTFAALHSKCMYGEACIGPGCRVTRNHYSTAEPRTRKRLRPNERRLAARVADWETSKGAKCDMHKPGSQH